MHRSITLAAILPSASLPAEARSATSFPSRQEILALMHRVDTYHVENPVIKLTDRNWERGNCVLSKGCPFDLDRRS